MRNWDGQLKPDLLYSYIYLRRYLATESEVLWVFKKCRRLPADL